jgi:type I restriction enzyme S subunit
MIGLRILQNGKWNKPPTLFAARRIFFEELGRHYPLRNLDDVATFLNGTSYSVSQVNDCAKHPIIRISNISDPKGRYLLTNEELDQRFWIASGDLLVSWSASFKTIIWPGPSGFLNQHIFKVTEREGFDKAFVRHAIEASFDLMQENVVGIGMMHLRRDDFLLHQIAAPPIHVQRAVAKYLDIIEAGAAEEAPELPSHLAEQRRIVARIEALAAEIEEAKRLRREAVEEAGVMGSASASRIIDRVESQHAKRFLGDLVTTRGGGTPSKSNPLFWSGSIPWISPKDMKRRELHDAQDHISEAALSETPAKLINPGAVLVVVRGMILAHTFPSAVLATSAAINQDMKALIPSCELDPYYLCAVFWAWNGRMLELVEKSTHDTRKLHTDALLAARIPLPPLPEQRRIVAELDALQAEVDSLKRLQSETAAELDALLPAILDRAFQGKL